MTPAQIVVTLAGAALAVAVNVWFFPRTRHGSRGASGRGDAAAGPARRG